MKKRNNIRGIIFSSDMALANLEGRKTETRRIIADCQTLNHRDSEFVGFTHSSKTAHNTLAHFRYKDAYTNFAGYESKYGAVGDFIYQKESLLCDDKGDWRYKADNALVMVDKADEWAMAAWAFHKEVDYCQSTFMPRFAARCWLQITDLRVERIQDITEESAIAEGVEQVRCIDLDKQDRPIIIMYHDYGRYSSDHPNARLICTASESYRRLWLKLHGRQSWYENPFVWVIRYKRIEKPAL